MKIRENDFSIGADVVFIPRITGILCSKERDTFLRRCFSEKEIKCFLDKKTGGDKFLAGRFALKEALVKITGNRRGIRFSEICCPSSKGKPVLKFLGKTMSVFSRYDISFSISHDNEYAFAVVIGRRKR
ncbi:MAG: holo-ACP synthase [Deltaproteobacteria bacterium]|nr:holo-ACP synthase [Deltaproteobacteria bacterium]